VFDLFECLQSALEARYSIEREIGHGGMAVVYRARDTRHDRIVALKVLQPRFSEMLGADRFLREIRVAARLHHPHLLPLYDSGEAGGFLYYVTPCIEGGSLRDLISREGRLAPARALRLAREVADALDYAHRQQVIHRDVKPENILLDEGHAIVADFGVARAVSVAAESTLTQPGLLVGTPVYMSPEQADVNAPLDGRSDIYSLGCVLYEMIAGHPPFTATSPIALLALRLTEPAPTLAAAGVSVSRALEHLVARILAREPGDRVQSAAELALLLGAAERQLDQGIVTPVEVPPPRTAAMAVLPFVNVSADPENEYFSDGITEELITALGRVEGLRVVSRASAFTFKGRGVDMREVGQRLNVGAVLEGSVRRAGDRVRVTAQLVDAANGYQLWSDSYERKLADVFVLQEELTQAIVRSLPLPVARSQPGVLVRPSTSAPRPTRSISGAASSPSSGRSRA
jgi:TolB-like protein/tRNA A-37 threonylcarbamoyl transferase component Bud32